MTQPLPPTPPPPPSADPVGAAAARVEQALGDGDLEAARVTLEAAQVRYGDDPRLHEMRHRLDELERVVRRPEVEARVGVARDRLQTADYPGALEALQAARALAPDDAEVRALLERTEKAAVRHAEALERQQAVVDAVDEVRLRLHAGDATGARDRLREAAALHGRHDAFERLQEEVGQALAAERLARARKHRQEARQRFEAEDWRGAVDQARRALVLEPGEATAESLRQRAQAELDRLEGARVHEQAVAEAVADVERLITAHELPRARRRLREAIDQLGEVPALQELAGRIDDETKDHRFRQRVEWAERRANEAESLIAEAGRRSLGGDFAGAVERLERARELDPSHPEIDERLATAREALARHRADDARVAERKAATLRISGLLDALELDLADGMLRQALRKFGQDERLTALGVRLAELRRAEAETPKTLRPADVAGLSPSVRATILERQRALAAAYPWRQAFAYPLRGRALGLLATVAAFLLVADLVGLLAATFAPPWLATAWTTLGWSAVAALAALVLAPAIARDTVAGGTALPPKPWARGVGELVLGACVVTLVLGPLLVVLAARPWTGLPSADGWLGWIGLAALLWLGAIVGVVLLAAGASFGPSVLARLGGHLGALRRDLGSVLVVADAVFVLLGLLFVARFAVVPVIWWLGALPSAVGAAYLVLVAPHLAGVLLRRARLQWAELYA
ncbi:MAG: hypothetical protein AAGC60_17985 [Acidobacteriota bacterium]